MSCSRQSVEKGKGRETTRSGLPALVLICGVPFLVENVVSTFRGSVGGFAFVDHLYCVGFDAEIVAQFRLVQR